MSFNPEKTENIRLVSVIEDLPMGIVLMDEAGIVVAVNTAFKRIVGDKKQNLIGTSIRSVIQETYKKKLDQFLTLTNENHHNHIREKSEFELITYNQQSFKLHIKNYPVEKNDIFLIGTVENDENVLKLENELEKQLSLKNEIKDDLEQESELSEMKSRFLSIASHEFRTPLAGILSSLNLIDRYIKADQSAWANFKNGIKVQNHLIKINESVKNLTSIINNFLAMGNIEKGEIPVKFVRINLKKVLEKQTAQFQEICKPGQILRYKHEGIEKMVILDKYLLRNILNNLLSNAIKFSPENSTIELNSQIDENTIEVVVSDRGIGIPEAEQNKVFSRFYRAKNALHYEEGTGLGLNIVKKYVELMNGNISFESKVNEGTTFYISFPKNL
jgi:PAS domain S-box-containing protein